MRFDRHIKLIQSKIKLIPVISKNAALIIMLLKNGYGILWQKPGNMKKPPILNNV